MKTRKRDSFSLIELLVVVAVIMILVALLVPVIIPMKERARRVECASNLHQLQIAAYNYAMEKGYFPPSHSYQQWVVPSGNPPYWDFEDVGWVAFRKPASVGGQNYVDYSGTNMTSMTTGSMFPYVGRTKVYACPTMRN